MGVSSSVDPGRPDPARHSIRTSFTLRVAVPAGCLALLWLLALAAALRLALAGRSLAGSHAILISYGLLAVAGLVAIAAGAALTGSFERMLARDLAALAAAAQQVAGLPAAARPGEQPAPPADAATLAAEAATTEVAQAAAAIASLRHTGRRGDGERVRPARRPPAGLRQSGEAEPVAAAAATSPDRHAGAEGRRPRRPGRPVRAGPPHHPDAAARGEPGHPVRCGPWALLARAGAGRSTSSGRR